MSRLLDIGVSGLTAHQTALATTGHNIANAGVEGYSRQEAVFVTNPPQFNGSGFIGSGVNIETIRRITDEFASKQVITDTTRSSELSILSDGLEQLDQLLADDNTGLATVLTELFNSLQSASESPTSISLRQQVVNQAERLVERYQSIQGQLESLADSSGQIITGVAEEINSLARSIANVNQRLIDAKQLSVDDEVNDLLDLRENLLKDLAEKVAFTTVKQDGESINVFVAGGQPLVLGVRTNELIVSQAQANSVDIDISINVNGTLRGISSSISGGELGGHLKFREQELAVVADELGLVQTLVVHNLNNLHSQGVDLNGKQGGDLFTSLNDRNVQLARVIYAPDNKNDDSVISVSIDDPSALVGSSYKFALGGVGVFNYTVTRESDGAIVSEGIMPSVFPQTIEVQDGFSFTLESGGFSNGDEFTLLPTRLPAANLEVLVSDPASLAFGLPVATQTSPGNVGTAVLSQLSSSLSSGLSSAQLQSVAVARANTPPLLIRFSSSTTYDVLDNSNPLAPVQLSPPLQNLEFLPGRANSILDSQADASVMLSTAAFSQAPVLGAIGTTNNGNAGEVITITTSNASGGTITSESVTVFASESAATAALRLSAVAGVSASANNELTLTLSDDNAGAPMQLALNGVDLTSITDGPVPQPLNTDFLAARINQLLGTSGVVASAQGANLTIRSLQGDDLVLENTGAGADSFSLTSANGGALALAVGSGQEVTTAGTVSLVLPAEVAVSSTGGFFGNSVVQAHPAFLGYEVSMSGVPQAGDRFTINLGNSGTGDNRNVLAMAQLQTADVRASGNASISDMYNRVVGQVGSSTSAARIDKEAAQSLLRQSRDRLSSISGVNLDEEAARLLQYEQVYNASARVIAIARSTFDTLLGAFS